ncbi:hypothetical protein [Spongiimicrobium salis]|uniref:hypothetical protein n=1 Tax=Spongiimicrobium salis TaxID=1667022 RepID=UPI00374D7220
MQIRKGLKIVVLGILIWMVPFLFGFLLYSETGELNVDIFLFKSIMMINLAIITAFSINVYLGKAALSSLKNSAIVGVLWMLIVLLLDVLILLPRTTMDSTAYINQIGLRYMIIPIICLSSGYSLMKQKRLP